MTAHSQLHGTRWPEFLCLEVIEAMTCMAAMMKQIVLSILRLYFEVIIILDKGSAISSMQHFLQRMFLLLFSQIYKVNWQSTQKFTKHMHVLYNLLPPCNYATAKQYTIFQNK